MTPEESMSGLSPTDPQLLDALASLNEIGKAINRVLPGGESDINALLLQIVDGATLVFPGAAAVVYPYNISLGVLDTLNRVISGGWLKNLVEDNPRPDGMSMQAILQRRRILSYAAEGIDLHPAKRAAGVLTAACSPLLIGDQPIGVLYLCLAEERAFSPLELLMLDNFTNLAALAVSQVQKLAVAQQDLARKDEELSHLRRAGLLISSRLRLEDTLEAILQMALEVTHANYGIFRLVDRTGKNLVTRAFAGEHLARPKVETLPIDSNSIMGWVARSRKPALISDLHSPPWSERYYPLDAVLEMRSELAVPLISSSGRMEGILNLESPQVGAFSEQDSHLLQSLATQAVITIQEVRLLDALQEVAQRLLTQPSQQVLRRLAGLACDLLNASESAIWTVEDQSFLLQASAGESLQDSSLARKAVEQKMTVAIDKEESHGLSAPLLSDDINEPLGAFSIFSTGSDHGRFSESEWDKKVLATLAHYAALAVRNASHQEALQAIRQQQAVAETFAVIGDISANLLHQLNNKVGTIPVRIQGIQDKCQDSLSTDSYLATNLHEIERSASEAMESVRENLTYLRPIQMAEVRVQSCVKAALEDAHLPPEVIIHCEDLGNLPPVVAGERSLTLVFSNIFDNAVDAMNGKGVIRVNGSLRRNQVEVTVSDTGPGIPVEIQDRIFELNYSGRATNRPGKLGFGLWWVRTLMTRLGGTVSVESDGQNGATFRIRLPAAGSK